MKLKKVLFSLALTLPVIATAAVDPVFDTTMTAIMADIMTYTGKAIGYIGGLFALVLAVKFALGFIRRIAK